MQRTYVVIGLAVAVGMPAATIAQVDYHRAQQAGKVWERKQQERNREAARRGGKPDVNSQGVAYDAPITDADRAFTKANNPGSYERLLRSVGRKNADSWLNQMARIERSKR